MDTNGKNVCQFTNWIPAAKNPAALVTVRGLSEFFILTDLTLLI